MYGAYAPKPREVCACSEFNLPAQTVIPAAIHYKVANICVIGQFQKRSPFGLLVFIDAWSYALQKAAFVLKGHVAEQQDPR